MQNSGHSRCNWIDAWRFQMKLMQYCTEWIQNVCKQRPHTFGQKVMWQVGRYTLFCVWKIFRFSPSLPLFTRFCCHQMCLFVTILLFSTLNCDPVETIYSVCCSRGTTLPFKDNERRTDVWWMCLLASHLVLHVLSQRTHTHIFNLHLPTEKRESKNQRTANDVYFQRERKNFCNE